MRVLLSPEAARDLRRIRGKARTAVHRGLRVLSWFPRVGWPWDEKGLGVCTYHTSQGHVIVHRLVAGAVQVSRIVPGSWDLTA